MQYAILVAGAALAHVVQAGRAKHHHHHARRDMDTTIEWVYETVTAYVTAGQETSTTTWQSYGTSSAASSAVDSSAVPTVSSSSSCLSSVTAQGWTSSTSAYTSSEPAPSSYAPTFTSGWTSSTSAYTSSEPAPSSYAPTSTSSSSAEQATSAYSSASTSVSVVASSSGITKSNLTPGGKKAGLSGYVGCQEKDAFSELAPYISWYSDYTASTPDANGVQGIGMLWAGDGSTCADTQSRLSAFESLIASNKIPEIMFGFYEPDCNCPDSSGMTSSDAANDWDNLIAPLAKDGTVLGSPSMCKQKDETFLTPFNASISTTWDVTSVHINKPDLDGIKAVVEYYWDTYQKPIWVSEFACVVDTPSWAPCTDQDQINQLINDAVAYFNGNEHVVAFGPSNGNGLGDVWPLTDSDGKLTTSGQTYLNAIKGL